MPKKANTKEVTVTGKTVQTAITKGLKELGLRRDQVEVNILKEERSGFLGIGAKGAKVTIREKKWTDGKDKLKKVSPRKKGAPKRKTTKKPLVRRPKTKPVQEKPKISIVPQNFKPVPKELEESAKIAKTVLEEILKNFGEKPQNIQIEWDDVQNRLISNFKCTHPEIIIGREGNTLQAIQYIVTLVMSRKTNKEIPLQADTENYWRKFEDKIINSIDYAVDVVKRTGQSYRLRPMAAAVRRFVHKYLAQKEDIETSSEGEGKWRKVVIKPKK